MSHDEFFHLKEGQDVSAKRDLEGGGWGVQVPQGSQGTILSEPQEPIFGGPTIKVRFWNKDTSERKVIDCGLDDIT